MIQSVLHSGGIPEFFDYEKISADAKKHEKFPGDKELKNN